MNRFLSLEAKLVIPVDVSRQSAPHTGYHTLGREIHCVIAFRDGHAETQRSISGTACSKACNDVSNEYL